MAEYTFTTTAGQTVARELLLAYLNTGTSSAPVWSVIGKRVEDSSEERKVKRDTAAALFARYEGDVEDHQILLTLIYEVI